MAANICIDESLTVGEDGVLSVARCGDGPEQGWPFDAAENVANGLRFDSSCGLWVAPPTTITQVGVNTSFTPGTTITPGNSSNSSPAVLNFTNNSTYLSAMLALNFHVEWRVVTSNTVFAGMWAGFNRGTTNPTVHEVATWFRPSGFGSAELGWVGTYSDYTNAVVDPGDTATFRLMAQAHSYLTSSVVFSNVILNIRGFAITMNNPTPVY